jgi:hypothetical protein
MTIHVDVEAGTNAHHMIEAAFKAFARALRAPSPSIRPRPGVPSTKGDPDAVTTVGIVDHGMGNRRSVEKALERDRRARGADGRPRRPARGRRPRRARRRRLRRGHARHARARPRRAGGRTRGGGDPVLGLCLGMQLLFDSSTELGGDRGLGLLPGGSSRSSPAR